MANISMIFLCILILIDMRFCFPSHGYRYKKQVGEETDYFSLREISWQLAANSMQGSVEAEIEVTHHDTYDARWYMQVAEGYYVPVARSIYNDVYNVRYWNSGRAFVNSKLLFHPVPIIENIELMLEISSSHLGPSLEYSFSAGIQMGYYPHIQVLHPDSIEPLSLPSPIIHYEPDETVTLHVQLKSKLTPEFSISKYMPAEEQSQLMIESVAEGQVDVSESIEGDWKELTFNVQVNPLQDDEKSMYTLRFSNENTYFYLNVLVLPPGKTSQYDEPHMSLNACNHTSKVIDTADYVKFEFLPGQDNCVYCIVGSFSPVIDVSVNSGGYPVGSGPTHSMYWYSVFPDITAVHMVILGQGYQSYSFEGNFTCSVYTADNEFYERMFEIDFI